MHAYIPMQDTSFTAVKRVQIILQIMFLLNMLYTSIYHDILVCTIRVTAHVFIQKRLELPFNSKGMSKG